MRGECAKPYLGGVGRGTSPAGEARWLGALQGPSGKRWRMASAMGPLVCVVDDDVSVRESVHGLFREEGFHVDVFESAEGFLGRTRRDAPACLVVDLVLPGMSGLDLHQELARAGMDTPTILLTGHGDIRTSVQAMKAG